jgi:hypothetical protein
VRAGAEEEVEEGVQYLQPRVQGKACTIRIEFPPIGGQGHFPVTVTVPHQGQGLDHLGEGRRGEIAPVVGGATGTVYLMDEKLSIRER